MRKVDIIAVCVLVTACQGGASETMDTAATKAAIDDVSARISRGFQSGQLDSVATLLTDDHVSMPPNLPPTSGRAQWLAWTKAAFVGGQLSSTTTPDARVYGDTLTIERGHYVNSFTPGPTAPTTARAMSDTGKYVWIWRKTATGWQMALAIWNSNSTPKP